MANTVNQASSNPTNKLSAATVAAAFLAVTGILLRNFAPNFYDPTVMAAILPVVVFAVGWIVPDQPNIVVVMPEAEEPPK